MENQRYTQSEDCLHIWNLEKNYRYCAEMRVLERAVLGFFAKNTDLSWSIVFGNVRKTATMFC